MIHIDPFTRTHGEDLVQRIVDGAKLKIPQIIKQAIETHDIKFMVEGERYYNVENDILTRKKYKYIEGVKIEDVDKPNVKIPHAWHKLLVDQKANYLVGNPINFVADDDRLSEYINEYLGEKFDDAAIDLAVAVSNKGQEWVLPYIDEDGEFDFLIIPSEQCIPIWQDERQKKLIAFIRYYPDGDTVVAEYYTDKDVTYYRSHNGSFGLDELIEENPVGHFQVYKSDDDVENYGWGKVPFIRFQNNTRMKTDLQFYKQIIDEWDKRVSDTQNSFDEIQDIIYVLKGYEDEDLGSFMNNLKYRKAISVSGDAGSGVDTLSAEIPMNSMKINMDNLKESLFTHGQGVDSSAENIGGAPSGVALQFLYSLLDLKASALERKWRPSLQELIWFLCEYLKIKKLGDYDYKSVDYVFKKRMIKNDVETSEIIQKSLAIISNKTLISNHPFVQDELQEQQRLEEEQEDKMSLADDDEDEIIEPDLIVNE